MENGERRCEEGRWGTLVKPSLTFVVKKRKDEISHKVPKGFSQSNTKKEKIFSENHNNQCNQRASLNLEF